MTACDESLESSVIWRLLLVVVFLGYLTTYICFIFFTTIFVCKLLFFIAVWLSLHLDEFIAFFYFLMPASVQQWRVEIGTFSCRYILRYPQSCKRDKTVVVGFAFGLLLSFFVILYFCYIL